MFKTYPFQNSTIIRIYSEKEGINTKPVYQRQGGVWTIQKKQLLIDSILNDYDVPKLYFHALTFEDKAFFNTTYEFAIIDGRQRIEAIWEFIEGEYTISDDFIYLPDENIKATGLSYADLAKEFPKLKIRFDSYILPIILIETDDFDLIEDMFSRLNEAVPLNAAEKRNALGGEMAKIIRETAGHVFFTSKIKFNDNRYQHREVAARLLFLIYSLTRNQKIIDTKKPYLDKMVINFRENPSDSPLSIYEETIRILNCMCEVFINSDTLLRSQSSITVYFLLFRIALANQTVHNITRKGIIDFYQAIEDNRRFAEKDITEANYELLEFERMTQQGTNDAFSIRERTRVMGEFLKLGPIS